MHVLGNALSVLDAESFPRAPCPAVWFSHDGQGAESQPLLQGIDVIQQDRGLVLCLCPEAFYELLWSYLLHFYSTKRGVSCFPGNR